jgi:hypothetical protein
LTTCICTAVFIFALFDTRIQRLKPYNSAVGILRMLEGLSIEFTVMFQGFFPSPVTCFVLVLKVGKTIAMFFCISMSDVPLQFSVSATSLPSYTVFCLLKYYRRRQT